MEYQHYDAAVSVETSTVQQMTGIGLVGTALLQGAPSICCLLSSDCFKYLRLRLKSSVQTAACGSKVTVMWCKGMDYAHPQD